MTWSNMTLVKIAAMGGLATVSMGLLYHNQLNNNIKNSDFYKEALKTVRTHKAAVHLLGEPIKDKWIDVENQRKNFARDTNGQYEIPLKGSKQNGILYMWINRANEMDKWMVNRLELQVSSEKDKRLLLKSSEK